MPVYDYDPDTGLPRDKPEPPSDELVTEQRRLATETRYAAIDAKTVRETA